MRSSATWAPNNRFSGGQENRRKRIWHFVSWDVWKQLSLFSDAVCYQPSYEHLLITRLILLFNSKDVQFVSPRFSVSIDKGCVRKNIESILLINLLWAIDNQSEILSLQAERKTSWLFLFRKVDSMGMECLLFMWDWFIFVFLYVSIVGSVLV